LIGRADPASGPTDALDLLGNIEYNIRVVLVEGQWTLPTEE
jgi:hypothetical protein